MANEEDAILARLLQDRTGITAAQGGGYRPATVNFDWLGQLPEIYDVAGQKQQRTRTLANLPESNLSDPNTSYDIARRLFASGDFEGGNKFMAHGMKQEEIKQRGIELVNMGTLLRKYPGGFPGPQPSPQTPVETVPEPVTNYGGGAPASSAPVNWGPSPLGPQSALPSSPSDQVIAAAQGATPGATPVQLAQAGGGLPPANAPAGRGLPSWLSGIDIGNPLTTAPPGGATAPLQAQTQLPAEPSGAPGVAGELQRLQGLMMQAGTTGRYGGGLREQLMTEYRNAVSRAYPTDKERQNYVTYKADAQAEAASLRAAGTPENQIPRLLDYSDWRLREQVAPKVHEEAMKTAGVYIDQGKSSREVIQLMQGVRSILDNPRFTSGLQTDVPIDMLKKVIGIRDTAAALGIPQQFLPDLSGPQTVTTLREGLTSMTNGAVVARLHGLGQQISNSDRDYTNAIFPNLVNTVAGNKLIAEYIQKAEEAKLKSAERINSYMIDRGVRASPYEIEAMVQREAKKNNIVMDERGNLTDLGKRMRDATGKPDVVNDLTKAIPPVIRDALPGGAPTERRAIGPDGKTYIIRPGRPPERID